MASSEANPPESPIYFSPLLTDVLALAAPVVTGLVTGDWLDALLGPFLGPAVKGRPKFQVTDQIIQHLAGSPFPPVRELAQSIFNLARQGAPVSSSDPQVRAAFARAIRRTISQILELYPLAGDYAHVARMVASLFAGGGQGETAIGTLDRVLARAAVRAAQPAFANPLLGVRPVRTVLSLAPTRSGARVGRPGARRAAVFVPRAPAPSPESELSALAARVRQAILSLPPAVRDALYGLQEALAALDLLAHGQMPNLTQLTALGTVLFTIITSGQDLTMAGLARLLMLALERSAVAAGLARLASQANYEIKRFARYLVHQPGALLREVMPAPQGGGAVSPPPSPFSYQPRYSPPGEIPTLDQTGECKTCSRTGREIAHQEGELQHEIQVETAQETAQQLGQIQKQIDDLRKLEQLPASQRDIPRELQQKQQLLRELQQMPQGGQGELLPPGPQGGQGELLPPAGQGGGVPTLEPPPQAQQPAQQPLESPTPPAPPAVTFCVGCQDQEDAILFLNGEPSRCSVIPGSTKVAQAAA